jgi:hypothetical protein
VQNESDAGAGISFTPTSANFESQFEKLMEEYFLKKSACVSEIRNRYGPQIAEVEE